MPGNGSESHPYLHLHAAATADISLMADDIHPEVLVIGGGPAGLRAAEIAADDGRSVVLCEAMPSVGRKFLVAGRGGLNLTHSEPLETFIARYGDDEPARWRDLLADFGPAHLRAWAEGLGVETYVGTSGRVFPRGQQAAGLLRRWVARLRAQNVQFRVHHRMAGLESAKPGWQVDLRETRTGETHRLTTRAVVLALGGASWPQTGSDGRWPALLRVALGVQTTPWQPANCGWEVAWDPRLLAAAEGLPLKNITLSAGGRTAAGEALITRYGLEGGALYQLGRELRAMASPVVSIDFKPGVDPDRLLARLPLGRVPSWGEISRCWRLGTAARALLEFHGQNLESDAPKLVAAVRNFPLSLSRARPVEEAISSAGGVPWTELDGDLMLRHHPGIFLAGEMIDWEAPTGGYLLQGCFATGTRAGGGACRHLTTGTSPST